MAEVDLYNIVNDIKRGVARGLNLLFNYNGENEFSYKYRIEPFERITSKTPLPCFSIMTVDNIKTRQIMTRETRHITLDVIYYPKEPNHLDMEELDTVSDMLHDCLERITLPNGDTLTNLNENEGSRIVDGLIHHIVRYDIALYKKSDEDIRMEHLDEDIKVGGNN